MQKIDVWGSCLSRVSLLDGCQTKHGIADDELELGYFIQRDSIVSAVMPRIFTDEEIDSISLDELWCHDRQILRAFKQSLRKESLPLLLNSESEWLLIDLYDMQSDVAAMDTTTFSHSAREFFNTGLYKKYQDRVGIVNFLDIPKWLWYGYVDLFFSKVVAKYGKDHIILNRFRCNKYYLDKDGVIKPLPLAFVSDHFPNPSHNDDLRELEDYIIERYDPYVIDISKFYMGDANDWIHQNGAHFELSFYYETFAQVKRIVKENSASRYYSDADFFSKDRRAYDKIRNEAFDFEENLKLFEKLLDEGDILWLNILDRMDIHNPTDPRVRQYLNALSDANR